MRLLIATCLFITAGLTSGAAADAVTECQALLAKRMPDERFWSIMEQTAAKDGIAQQDALENLLAKLSADEVLAFDMTMRTEQIRAYRWDVWGVGYIANGGMSDDGFHYFRYWLISRGRSVFERVLADVDSLADIVPADQENVLENELLSAAALTVWLVKTKSSFDAYSEHLDKLDVCQSYPPAPLGTKAASFEESYPKTWKRFGKKPLR